MESIPANPQTLQALVVGMLIMGSGTILSVVVSVFTLIRAGKPQKREVMFSADYASRSELQELKDHISATKRDADEGRRALYAEVKGLRIELMQQFSAGIEGVHSRVNDVLAAVSELKGKVNR